METLYSPLKLIAVLLSCMVGASVLSGAIIMPIIREGSRNIVTKEIEHHATDIHEGAVNEEVFELIMARNNDHLNANTEAIKKLTEKVDLLLRDN